MSKSDEFDALVRPIEDAMQCHREQHEGETHVCELHSWVWENRAYISRALEREDERIALDKKASELHGMIACTSADIHGDHNEYRCKKAQGLHTFSCKAHCLEHAHEPTACIFDVCCPDAQI